jgi:hypothetical protein
MTETRFTLGPLTAERSETAKDEYWSVGIGQPGDLHGCDGDGEYFLVSGFMPEAYAHLFVASPDLYEALRGCVRALAEAGNQDHLPAYNSARAALSKARGESSHD